MLCLKIILLYMITLSSLYASEMNNSFSPIKDFYYYNDSNKFESDSEDEISDLFKVMSYSSQDAIKDCSSENSERGSSGFARTLEVASRKKVKVSHDKKSDNKHNVSPAVDVTGVFLLQSPRDKRRKNDMMIADYKSTGLRSESCRDLQDFNTYKK